MTEGLVTSIVTVLTAIIGVAILAVLVSRQSQTAAVVQAGSRGFSQILGTALSPVTGAGGGFGSVLPTGFNVTLQ